MAIVPSFVYGHDAQTGLPIKLRSWLNNVTGEHTLMSAPSDAVTQPQPVSGTVTADVGSGTRPISAAALPLPAGAATETTLAALNTKIPASPATAGNQSTANTSLASILTALTALSAVSTTGTHANVAASTSVVTLQALNTARLGWTVFNDSTAVLTIKCGSAASATSFTIQVAAGGYWELPFKYTGIITGLWASATGNARVVEFI